MRILVVPVLLTVSMLLSGCSAFLAASGREAPDLTTLAYGSSRAQIDSALG
jgi:uncharacterized protein YceK